MSITIRISGCANGLDRCYTTSPFSALPKAGNANMQISIIIIPYKHKGPKK